jgi:16S rRNA (uracil1498-N3)-methyltransferase
MPKFFLPSENIGKSDVVITGGDARHIAASLRMSAGDRLVVCDYARREYECIIISVSPDRVTADIKTIRTNDTEPPYSVRLFQAAAKGDKFDIIVQKAVETGVSAVIPFISERCISRPDEKSAQRKRERLQRIAAEAAMQCGRGIIPEILPQVKFAEAVVQAAQGEFGFICYEGEGTVPLVELLRSATTIPRDIRFIVGSEGGFSAAEIETAKSAGLNIAGLGKRILRCETAPVFVLSCLSYEYELCGKMSD